MTAAMYYVVEYIILYVEFESVEKYTKALKGHGDFQKKAISKSLYRIVQSVLTD